MVVSVGYENFILCIDRDGVGQTELARCVAAFAAGQQQPTLRVKNLHVVEHAIHDIEVTGVIHRHAFGSAEMAGAIARTPERAHKFSVCREHLDAVIQRIRDVNLLLVIHGDVRGEIKFARAITALPELGNKFSRQITDDDLMTLHIGDKEMFARQRKAGRTR
jgi:hypothetical protein